MRIRLENHAEGTDNGVDMPAVNMKSVILSLLLATGSVGVAHAMDPLLRLKPGDLNQRVEGEKKTGRVAQEQLPARPAPAIISKTAPKTVSTGRRSHRQASASPPFKEKVIASGQSALLTAPPATANEVVDTLISFWPRLIGADSGKTSPIEVNGRNYSLLSFDPVRYPTLAAANGTRIIIDPDGSIDPLIKSILQSGKEPVRVVTESPVNRHPFFHSLLTTAGFYSIEDNFNVTIGADPEVTVHAEFKIERSAGSLLKEEMVLLNVTENGHPLPYVLVTYLANEGFEVMEPFARQEALSSDKGRLCQITAKAPLDIADSLLRSLAIPFEPEINLELSSYGENGLVLNMKVDRYFEKDGERFAIRAITGDPAESSLTRLLESKGYSVILLEKKDDLARVAAKILAKLKMQGDFNSHNLLETGDNTYAVKLSGLKLKNDGTGRKLMLTGMELDPLARELAEINGYQVVQE